MRFQRILQVVDFEWSPDKNEAVRARRGFDFDTAIRIFDGAVIEWRDLRDFGEVRIVAVGVVDGIEIAVIYTMRGEVRRIITARRARREERRRWHAMFG